MQVLECRDWVLWVAQIPDVKAWVLVIVVRYHELGGHERVPDNLSFFNFNGGGLARLVEIVVLVGVDHAFWLRELEN